MKQALALATIFLTITCASAPRRTTDEAMLDDVERRTFHYFWDLADPNTFLIPDRAPTPSFSSIAAVGFGLTAYGIAAERGYVTREQAAQRTLKTLQSLLAMKQELNSAQSALDLTDPRNDAHRVQDVGRWLIGVVSLRDRENEALAFER